MSVAKLVAEADHFLQNGKIQEATAKYQAALKEDSNNEAVANKLAMLFVEEERIDEAVDLYVQLATNASDKGKIQKAIAFYKRALGYQPNNLNLIEKLAQEHEHAGQHSEAAKYNQELIDFFIPRKRYTEAIPVCARLVHNKPKDFNVKLAWLELLKLNNDDIKCFPALVYFLGPPGINSEAESIGGNPEKLPLEIYQALCDFVLIYPKSPVIPYALAWAAYKRKDEKQSFFYLQESFRRDPDYSLSILLFARILLEANYMAEAEFVKSYVNEVKKNDKYTEKKVIESQQEALSRQFNFSPMASDTNELSPEKFLENLTNTITKSVNYTPKQPNILPPVISNKKIPLPKMEQINFKTISPPPMPEPALEYKPTHKDEPLSVATPQIMPPKPNIEWRHKKNKTKKVPKKSLEQTIAVLNKLEKKSYRELLAKGDTYLNAEDYYLARKTYLLAQKVGAPENLVKEKLKKLREKEFPEAFYNFPLVSKLSKKEIREIVDRLNSEFDLGINLDALKTGNDYLLQKIVSDIDTKTNTTNPQINLDIGIAFFEMGMFEEARNYFTKTAKQDSEWKLAAEALTAESFLAEEKYSEAISLLLKQATNIYVTEKEKIALFYLLGLAYEGQNDKKMAQFYFSKVAGIEKNYRSVKEKLLKK